MSAGTVSRIASSAVKPGKASFLARTTDALARVMEKPSLMKKIYYLSIYHPKLGLNTDDCMKRNFYAKGVLNEAVKRLPTKLQEERQFRIKRAVMHSGNKTIPKMKNYVRFGQDLAYMEEAVGSVIRDIETRSYWDLNGTSPPESVKVTPEEYRKGLEAIINSMSK